MLYLLRCCILMSVVYMCVSLFGLPFILYSSMVSIVYVLLLSEVGGNVGDTMFIVFEIVLARLYCVPIVFNVCVLMFLVGRL